MDLYGQATFDASVDEVFSSMTDREKEQMLEKLMGWKKELELKKVPKGARSPLLEGADAVEGSVVVRLEERVRLGILTKAEGFDEVVKMVTGFAPVGGG